MNLRRVGVVVAWVLAAFVIGAAPASAHVHVSSDDATQGGYTTMTFTVPTESETASTTKVTVRFPKDNPIASASVQAMPGWTAKVTTAPLAEPMKTPRGEATTYVTQVTWTAERGSEVKPGEFQTFAVSVGPLPKRSWLAFPTDQTYSDGSVVKWEQVNDDSEHPVPILTIAEAISHDHSMSGMDDMAGMDHSSSSGSGAAAWVSWAALVLAGLATVISLAAFSGPRPAKGNRPATDDEVTS